MKYELTLTLKGCIKKKTPPEQFNKTEPFLREILKGFKASMIAELHQDNDVHYHGLVELNDHKERNTLLNRIRKYHDFGRKTCSQVRWENSYDNYMKKDYNITRDILERCPIVIDNFNVFKDLLCEIVSPEELEELCMVHCEKCTQYYNIDTPDDHTCIHGGNCECYYCQALN